MNDILLDLTKNIRSLPHPDTAVGTRNVLWVSVVVALHDISLKRPIYCLSLNDSYNDLL